MSVGCANAFCTVLIAHGKIRIEFCTLVGALGRMRPKIAKVLKLQGQWVLQSIGREELFK